MSKITLACLSVLSLSACASTDFMTGMTAEQIQMYPEVYQQRLAQAQQSMNQIGQMNQGLMLQNQQRTGQLNQSMNVQAQTPVLGANGTYSTAYCRELASDLITCKQIR